MPGIRRVTLTETTCGMVPEGSYPRELPPISVPKQATMGTLIVAEFLQTQLLAFSTRTPASTLEWHQSSTLVAFHRAAQIRRGRFGHRDWRQNDESIPSPDSKDSTATDIQEDSHRYQRATAAAYCVI
jgi:hypothetical protein